MKDGFLINPIVIDARTEITTQLLSDEGYTVEVESEDGEFEEQSFTQRQFERKFFSDVTNKILCKTFLENAMRDPISKEIGKCIVFAVSQKHAVKITQILNEMADIMYPGKYNSDFAVQVTSQVDDAQQFTINFANNNLLGSANFLDEYKTSKARVCVTVGMMTTGYDCEDILNLCLMRPIFSPTDFIQIKGRGTRKHDFTENLIDLEMRAALGEKDKTHYKLFDFFANCEYFEDDFNYDEVLDLPKPASPGTGDPPSLTGTPVGPYENIDPDHLVSVKKEEIGYEGMKIDRMFFRQFETTVVEDAVVKKLVEQEQWDKALEYVNTEMLNKPDDYFTIEKLRKSAGVDRRLGLREILEKAFGKIDRFKPKNELLDEEFDKLVGDLKPDDANSIVPMKYFFKAYITDNNVRDIVETKNYTRLNTNAGFTMKDFKAVPEHWRNTIPNYVKDYVSLNRFMS